MSNCSKSESQHPHIWPPPPLRRVCRSPKSSPTSATSTSRSVPSSPPLRSPLPRLTPLSLPPRNQKQPYLSWPRPSTCTPPSRSSPAPPRATRRPSRRPPPPTSPRTTGAAAAPHPRPRSRRALYHGRCRAMIRAGLGFRGRGRGRGRGPGRGFRRRVLESRYVGFLIRRGTSGRRRRRLMGSVFETGRSGFRESEYAYAPLRDEGYFQTAGEWGAGEGEGECGSCCGEV